MTSMTAPSSRAGRLSKLFNAFVYGERLVGSSQDAKLFFEAVDIVCQQKSPAVCIELILSKKEGLDAVRNATRSNLSPTFITTTTTTMLKHLSDPSVKSLNDGGFLQKILAAMLSPPTFWTAFVDIYRGGLNQEDCLLVFAWLCLEIVSAESPELQVLFSDVKSLMDDNSLVKASYESVRSLGYRIQKIILIRSGSPTASVTLAYSPGGRHDNDFADFRQIAIYPTADEVSYTQQPFLQRLDDIFEAARESRAYNHLDWLYRLLREDMLADLREDLQIAWGQKKAKRKPLCLGELSLIDCNVGIPRQIRPFTLTIQCGNGVPSPPAKYTTEKARKKYFEEFKSILKHNSFGALCYNNTVVAFGSVVRDIDMLAKQPPAVGIQVIDATGLRPAIRALLGLERQHLKFYVVDTATFAYEPILQRLKLITEIPLENSLLNPKGPPADYQLPEKLHSLLSQLKASLNLGREVDLSSVLSLLFPVKIQGAQLKSLINGLESPVAQIQGPPGTGKSFIGALIAQVLLTLTDYRVLVLSYTNHALDQFMEDLMGIGIGVEDMVRIGSKASAKTDCLRMDYLSRGSEFRLNRTLWNMLNTLNSEHDDAKETLETLLKKMKKFTVSTRDILDMLEVEEPLFWEAFQVAKVNNDFNIAGRKNRPMEAKDLYQAWVQSRPPKSVGLLANQMSIQNQDIWAMPKDRRVQLHAKWNHQIRDEQINDLVELGETLNHLDKQIGNIYKERKRLVVQSKRLIGCTTTAAAMYQSIIQAAKPDVVLVEEAGEILEAHVIAAMGSSVKQLILIGDHKQLRPKVNNYNLTVEKGEGYDLNVSLFERLIRQGHYYTTLQEQHRSHPDISQFARLLAYPELKDVPKTRSRGQLRGFRERVAFIHHNHPEDQLEDVIDRRDPTSKSSKRNTFEADMVLKTVKYLNQQGYTSENIVVLTPYLGQLSLLRQKLSEINDPYLNDLDSHELVRAGLMTTAAAQSKTSRLRLSTVDNYQGEESDIVIISLTRSNERGDIGFLVARERLVVLISRARDGLILFGNMNTFLASKKGGELWKEYFDALKKKGFLFDGVPVKCEQHSNRTALLKTPGDFDQHCPDGGCSESCGKMLSCGKHPCERRCHRLSDHSKSPCNKTISKSCERGHKMEVQCGNSNQGCKSCAYEDQEHRRRSQRDLGLERKREERHEKYLRERQEIDDEIDHHRRSMKYDEETKSQQQELAEKKAQLRNLQEAKANMKLMEGKGTATNNPTKQGGPQPLKHISNMSSAAGKEWEDIKSKEGASNSTLDELMSMIGLESVKEEFLSVKSMVDTRIRQRVSFSDERYWQNDSGPNLGKISHWLSGYTWGLLQGNHRSKLANMGVSGCEKLLEEIKDGGGGVLFIDEAYQLSSGNSPGGKAVLDFLLAEVENLKGKVVFVLAGYTKQMESFFAHNPGFQSRFPIEMTFADYSDTELREILELKVHRKYNGRMNVEGGLDGLYFRIAARRVGRGRGKDGFGNARAIENALNGIVKRQADRIRLERRAGSSPDDFLFTKDDIIGPEPSLALKNCAAWKKLNEMVGLKEVKEAAKMLCDSLKTNYERELAEEPLMEFSLNRVFLGSPGTGKTTVAKHYGQILAALGLLTNGEVVVKTPADFVGAALGQSEAQTKGILAATIGKVLVIDEAYGLYGGQGSVADPYKTAVIDTIVGEVQNVPGDDRCVILIGYQEQMETMFQNVNPGLSRRFSVDNPFKFEDFDDEALRQVLNFKLKSSGFTATKEGQAAALDVLVRERNRPNFGNGGAVENLLSKAKAAFQKRRSEGKSKGNLLQPTDFDEDFARSTRAETNVRQLFQDEVGREDIILKLEHIQTRVRQLKAIGMDVKEEIPFNFLFRGPPGTGKTTTARKMGRVYYDMGFLAKPEVEECSATDLIGEYVGQTGPKVKKVLDKCLGRVLLIDEAYRLAEGHFAKEAVDELVDCVTKPRYQGKLIIILAGYGDEINRLLSVNPGLSSRFPESISFEPLSAVACFQLLSSLICKRKVELASKKKIMDVSCLETPSASFKTECLNEFRALSQTEGWASARDVKNIARNVFQRVDLSKELLKLEESHVAEELQRMFQGRKGVDSRHHSTAIQSSKNPVRMKEPSPSPCPGPITTVSSTFSTTKTEVSQDVENETLEGESPPELDQLDSSQYPQPVRDAGVSDEVWEQLQKDRAEEQRREAEYRALRKAQKTARDADRRKIVQQLLEEEERRKKEAAMKAKLMALGACPVGYQWIKQESGYRCAGGSHYLAESDLEKLTA